MVSGLYAWNEDTPGAEIGPTKGKVDADAGGRAGAAHSHLGKSAGRAEGRGGGDHRRHSGLGANPGTLFADGVDEGGPDVRVVGRRVSRS